MIIVKNVKGIKELKIVDKDFDSLIKNKIHGIYGANGTGKSSLKEAISLINKPENWNLKTKEQYVNKNINFSSNLDLLAIFDERITQLIRYNNSSTKINLFGSSINSLYQLLLDKENEIKQQDTTGIITDIERNLHVVSKELDFIKEKNIFVDLKNIIMKIKLNDPTDLLIQHHIVKLIIDMLNGSILISSNTGHIRFRADNGVSNIRNSKMKNLQNIVNTLNKEVQLSDEFIKEIEKLKALSIKELENIISFIKSFHFIVKDFGYTNLENDNIYNNFTSNLELIGIYGDTKTNTALQNIKTYFTNEKNRIVFLDISNTLFERVEKNKLVTNTLLESYNLNYSLELKKPK